MRSLASALTLSFVLAGAFAACSADSEGGGGTSSGGTSSGGTSSGGTSSGGTSSGGTSSGGSGGTSSGGSSGSGGTSSGGSGGSAGTDGSAGDAGIADVSFTYDGPVGDDGSIGDACAATTVKADPAPLDMFIMLDNSGSMGADCNIGQGTTSKWCYSINALSQFFTAAPTGTGVAMQYFPKCAPSASASDCTTGGGCATAEVPLGLLPGNLAALNASLDGTTPNGGTPMEAALNGLTKYTQQNKQAGRVMIGVFITDGVPEGCTTNPNTLAGIVQNHLTTNGIKTFMIGMDGANFGTLDSIAAPGGASPHTQYCGGSSPCYSYDVDNGNPAAFNAVLAAIQKSAVACQYAMPTTDGGIIDLNKVEVQYFPAGNPPSQKLPKVANAAACAGGGWFFDSAANPKSILLCPSSCTVVQLDTKAKIEVSLGCLGS
jgi:Mg-chelatase subunit ChlD